MTDLKFDLTVQKLINDWEFDLALDFLKSKSSEDFRKLEFCVYLADFGLLNDLHEFISGNGLYNLKKAAADVGNPYEKRESAKTLLDIYESEMLAVFEHQFTMASNIDGNLLKFASYRDLSILKNYIETNKESIFQADQSPKTLMYLTYAIGELLKVEVEEDFLRLLLEGFDVFKKMAPIRKAYITKNISLNLICNHGAIVSPKNGYSALHKILATIVEQKNRYNGARRLYALISNFVHGDLEKTKTTKKLGGDCKPKVAVCLSGMHRCNNKALESIYNNVIKPLDADVFFHSWSEMQEWPGLGGAGDDWLYRLFNKDVFNKCPTSLRSKKYFKDKFPRTYSVIDTPVQSCLDLKFLPSGINFKDINLEDSATAFKDIDESKFLSLGNLNQAKMLYGIYKSHEMAVEHEKKNGFRYDYIIRCRPDVGIYNQLNFTSLEKLRSNEVAMDFTKEYGPQDQFWYAKRSAALSMASLWTASVDSNSLSPFTDLPHLRSHRLIISWMVENHLEPVHMVLKRDVKMVTANAVLPDFSKALAQDLEKEASEFKDDREVLGFFANLLDLNKQ